MSRPVQSSREEPLPDFLIVGAMKSGTTSLYTELRQHPGVFMPPLEVGFFDIDDIRQHPDFFKQHRSRWHFHPFTERRLELVRWYQSLFEGARPGQLKGERSTTYMASDVAPGRIRDLVPEAKLIFMLRDPVKRAYSNYWHLLRSGEATASFEKTLRHRPAVLFDRGLYRSQVRRYLDLFPRDQLLFLVFEEFVRHPKVGLAEVCKFLGADPARFPESVQNRHENRGRYPWSRHVQYGINTVLFHGALDGHRYLGSHLPALQFDVLDYSRIERWVRKVFMLSFKVVSRVNCSKRARPEMNQDTQRMLKYLYEDRNAGLGELIGKDLAEWWPVTQV